jgi:hypothetical protein
LIIKIVSLFIPILLFSNELTFEQEIEKINNKKVDFYNKKMLISEKFIKCLENKKFKTCNKEKRIAERKIDLSLKNLDKELYFLQNREKVRSIKKFYRNRYKKRIILSEPIPIIHDFN